LQKLYATNGPPVDPALAAAASALLLQIFYSIRSRRMLVEQLDYNLLFRWFVGMSMDERTWVSTVFTMDLIISRLTAERHDPKIK
jgi:transposase